MAGMGLTDTFLREQLMDRRQRLESALTVSNQAESLETLLREVDAALGRMDTGAYGICEVCHEPVEKERLIADPLVRFCLDHLTPDQQSALEYDLTLASQIQREMLPSPHSRFGTWEVFYHYQPLGPVSGDYCDVLARESGEGSFFFALGDASGKGVAASMLMAHLHAIFRALVASGLSISKLVERAGRLFRESAMSPHFATLVCGRTSGSGVIEICNAGHCPPLLLRGGRLTALEATGVPLGLFSDGEYSAQTLELTPGDAVFLYTDGLSEARNHAGQEYGEARLHEFARGHHALSPQALVGACLEDLAVFLAGAQLADDLTVMAICRTA